MKTHFKYVFVFLPKVAHSLPEENLPYKGVCVLKLLFGGDTFWKSCKKQNVLRSKNAYRMYVLLHLHLAFLKFLSGNKLAFKVPSIYSQWYAHQLGWYVWGEGAGGPR